jgi:hypothetical protein
LAARKSINFASFPSGRPYREPSSCQGAPPALFDHVITLRNQPSTISAIRQHRGFDDMPYEERRRAHRGSSVLMGCIARRCIHIFRCIRSPLKVSQGNDRFFWTPFLRFVGNIAAAEGSLSNRGRIRTYTITLRVGPVGEESAISRRERISQVWPAPPTPMLKNDENGRSGGFHDRGAKVTNGKVRGWSGVTEICLSDRSRASDLANSLVLIQYGPALLAQCHQILRLGLLEMSRW